MCHFVNFLLCIIVISSNCPLGKLTFRQTAILSKLQIRQLRRKFSIFSLPKLHLSLIIFTYLFSNLICFEGWRIGKSIKWLSTDNMILLNFVRSALKTLLNTNLTWFLIEQVEIKFISEGTKVKHANITTINKDNLNRKYIQK